MKVSVVVATIGSPALKRGLKSLFSQQGVELEVVLVNDNPDFVIPDEILQLDRRLVVVNSAINRGAAGAANLGFAYCTGDLLVRQDDDDVSLPGRLRKLVSLFRENAEIDIACSWAYGFQEGSGGKWLMKTPRDGKDLVSRLRFTNCIIHSTVAITRDAFLRVGGYSDNFRYAQDYDLYLRCAADGFTFLVIQEPLVEKHFTSGSVTLTRRKQQILHSLAAQCLYCGRGDRGEYEKWVIVGNILRLFVPDQLRRLLLRIRSLLHCQDEGAGETETESAASTSEPATSALREGG